VSLRTFTDIPPVVATMLWGISGIVFASFAQPTCKLLYNPSESAPRGWYAYRPVRAYPVGVLVLARLPEGPARLADDRHYLPVTVPALKRVAAVSGERVCERNGVVTINGEVVARARARDGAGRPLSPWTGCRLLADDELFLLNRDSSSSFDARYFGPIHRSCVIGWAVPIWTWR